MRDLEDLICPFEKKRPSFLKKNDEFFMSLAYNQAIDAWNKNETPIGAVGVYHDDVICCAHNSVISLNDPTAHAEMLVISQAARVFGDWRLNDLKIYVTKEPCPMCSGAMIMSRVGCVIFGAPDEKMGCLGGCFKLPNLPKMNHRPVVIGGVLQDDCEEILREFFKLKRQN